MSLEKRWNGTGWEDVGVPTTVVTTDTSQTVSGLKTFTTAPVLPTGSIPLNRLIATGTADSTTYLRGDGTWQVISGGGGTPANMVTTDTSQVIASKTIRGNNIPLFAMEGAPGDSGIIATTLSRSSGTVDVWFGVTGSIAYLSNDTPGDMTFRVNNASNSFRVGVGNSQAAPTAFQVGQTSSAVYTPFSVITSSVTAFGVSGAAGNVTTVASPWGRALGTTDAWIGVIGTTKFFANDAVGDFSIRANSASGSVNIGYGTGNTGNAALKINSSGIGMAMAPNITDLYTTTNPTLPTQGFKLYSKEKGGRSIPAFVGAENQDTSLQPAFFANSLHLWVANTGLATATTYGWAPTTSTLTAVSTASTNFYTMLSRVRMTSAATAGSMVEWRNPIAEFSRIATASLGGWYFVARFGLGATAAGNRVFVGFNSSTGAMTNVDPSTLLNIVGFGCNTAQNTMQVYTNDATGTATMVDLGANFPLNTSSTDFYEVRMFVPSGSTGYINWSVERLNTGHYASGQITTDMPVAGTMLAPHIFHSNGATAAAVSMDIQQVYIETDN